MHICKYKGEGYSLAMNTDSCIGLDVQSVVQATGYLATAVVRMG